MVYSSTLFSHHVRFTINQRSNPNTKLYKQNNRRTLTASALGVDTFDGTTLAATPSISFSPARPPRQRLLGQIGCEELLGSWSLTDMKKKGL
ncbi:hypothetical protein L1987_05381 [Smallanthus sonchifolius]|uniref:Uncharacterized protein n=1 Tax=Smallanthus sonchifolius TaxID=185202 RepID=A0ACB9JV73_9ASTR|nr:hypothetical protein L1987_05381 [Smallanthus sonchifolius]